MLSRKLLLFLIWMQKFLMIITTISVGEPESTLKNHAKTVVGELHDAIFSFGDFQLKIPKQCQETNICQHIPDYPQKYISNLIANLQSQGKHLTYDVKGWTEDEKDLCHSIPEVIFPQAVRDRYNNWYLALNSPKVPQRIIGRKCKTASSDCSPLIHFEEGYVGCCNQRYMLRKIVALDRSMKNVTIISTPVPSCCNCVAKKVKDSKED